jgi:thiopeptide-type bacteriocin biosynthesis protein
MAWLQAFAAGLESKPEVRRRLRMVVNPSMQVVAGRVVLRERVSRNAESPSTELSILASKAVCQVILLAREAIPYEVLQEQLTEATQADPTKVEKLLCDLWEQGVLLTDLTPSCTSPDPARQLAGRLRGIEEATEERAALSSLLDDLAVWDAMEPECAVAAGRAIADRARAICGPGSETPFQVDLALSLAGNQLNGAVAEEVARAAELLLRLSPFPDGPPSVIAHRQAFVSRYNEGREVPLLDLLDRELGLGPLDSFAPPKADGLPAAPRAQTLLALACRALRTRQRVVKLDGPLLTELQTWSPAAASAPPSLDVSALVGARSAAALDAGEFQVVIGANVGAGSGGRTLGRFAYLFGREGTDVLRDMARTDDSLSPQTLAAELVYKPRWSRAANLIIRPAIREYEVHIDGCASPGGARVIPLDELVVGVRNDRYYLRWQGDGREVRITSGHMLNTTTAPAAARFLSEVGEDRRVQLAGFSWGPAEGFPYLPRVESGRVVLRPAQWRIDPAVPEREFRSDTLAQFRDELARWREAWDVPRHVFLAEADNRLLLDLEDPAQVAEFFHDVRKLKDKGSLVLQEVLPGLDQVWLDGPGGHYYAEVVVPLVNRGSSTPVTPDTASTTRRRETRRAVTPSVKPPGSDWLYLKVYCGSTVHDDLIAGPLRELNEFLLAEKLVDHWFFLRYADPEPHLRVRYGGDPAVLIGQLLPVLCNWASALRSKGYCNRFTFDTYEREVERYGGAQGIEVAEAVFCADSVAVETYTKLLIQRASSLDKETLAVLTVDNLLDGFGLSELERTIWLRSILAHSAEVGAVYRKRRDVLRSELAMARRRDAGLLEQLLLAAMSTARSALAPCGRRLTELEGQCKLSTPLARIYGSFVHMHCNRLLGIDRSAESRVLGLLLRTSVSLEEAPACCGGAPSIGRKGRPTTRRG